MNQFWAGPRRQARELLFTSVPASAPPCLPLLVTLSISSAHRLFEKSAIENTLSGQYDEVAFDLAGYAASRAVGRQISKQFARPMTVEAPPKGHTRVYRAVSEAEYQDILITGRLRQGPNSMEGKWFADTPEGVRLHGDALEGARNYRVIEVDMPDNLPSLHLDPNLDLRGPARYLDGSDLLNLNPRPFRG